ncbi:MAG: hypothetical protein J6O71_01285, partial [Lachnospiraceae bacterium]|nr:hypothetical protein [Lachnospiraceae bacterium]
MEKRSVNIKSPTVYYSYFIAAFLCLVFFSVLLVMVVKNVFYEDLGVENAFVHMLLDGGTFEAGDDEAVEVRALHPGEEHVDINWEVLYPFNDWNAYGWGRNTGKSWGRLDFYRAAVDNFEAKLGIYTGELLIFQRNVTIANSKLQNMLGWRLYADVIPMTNGHLAAPYKRLKEEEMTELADSVADFNSYLASNGIPLIYVNAPTKVAADDRQMIDPGLENSNENADELLSMLDSRGVNTLDFRDEIKKTGKSQYDFYYRLDHHWTTASQLWAAGVLSQKLNKDCGFDFDPETFKPESYEKESYDNAFLGSYGRIVVYQGLLDSFERIKPAGTWDISVTIPSRNVLRRGDYEEVFVEKTLL